MGNAKDFPNNKFPEGWKIVENKPSTIPKRVGLQYLQVARMLNMDI